MTPPSASAPSVVPEPQFAIGDDFDEDNFDDQPTLADDLKGFAEDARSLALAELAYQKSRASYVGSEVKGIAILAVAGLVVLFFAVMALVVGLVIALGPLLTAWGAMAAVTGGLLIITGMCVFAIKRRFARMSAILSDDDDEGERA